MHESEHRAHIKTAAHRCERVSKPDKSLRRKPTGSLHPPVGLRFVHPYPGTRADVMPHGAWLIAHGMNIARILK